jgi:AraC-like DNA-binding protein
MVQVNVKKPVGRAGDLILSIVDYSIDDEIDRVKITVLPTVTTVLCFHYSGGMRTEFGGAIGRHRGGLIGMHSAVRTCWPCGPLGSITVWLHPEAVASVIGGQADEITDALFDLSSVFPPLEVRRLEDRLASARTSRERIALVEDFIVRLAKSDRPDGRTTFAVQLLQRDSTCSIRDLARRVGLSERQFSRRFRDAIGVPPQQFARLARFVRVCGMGRRGDHWAQAASEAGYVDQAHMVNDFRQFVGAPPGAALRELRSAREPGLAGINAIAAASDFCNNFFS